ncbi:hypothetical protein D9758_016997 [Tetrapyrgos nigripes]|uniref:Uncharacterized protein n=1 Tax=Tetrapyrgos nigripes TaxID=182062 RepID=A0A8H5C9C5_9AGAR|nr:hypothetical protein D9758_016997 [Tetrapyrgos nigripes]
MHIVVGIHRNEIKRVLETYNLLSERYFTHASPTLFKAGTLNPQLSSRFLLCMKEDYIEGIYDSPSEEVCNDQVSPNCPRPQTDLQPSRLFDHPTQVTGAPLTASITVVPSACLDKEGISCHNETYHLAPELPPGSFRLSPGDRLNSLLDDCPGVGPLFPFKQDEYDLTVDIYNHHYNDRSVRDPDFMDSFATIAMKQHYLIPKNEDGGEFPLPAGLKVCVDGSLEILDDSEPSSPGPSATTSLRDDEDKEDSQSELISFTTPSPSAATAASESLDSDDEYLELIETYRWRNSKIFKLLAVVPSLSIEDCGILSPSVCHNDPCLLWCPHLRPATPPNNACLPPPAPDLTYDDGPICAQDLDLGLPTELDSLSSPSQLHHHLAEHSSETNEPQEADCNDHDHSLGDDYVQEHQPGSDELTPEQVQLYATWEKNSRAEKAKKARDEEDARNVLFSSLHAAQPPTVHSPSPLVNLKRVDSDSDGSSWASTSSGSDSVQWQPVFYAGTWGALQIPVMVPTRTRPIPSLASTA